MICGRVITESSVKRDLGRRCTREEGTHKHCAARLCGRPGCDNVADFARCDCGCRLFLCSECNADYLATRRDELIRKLMDGDTLRGLVADLVLNANIIFRDDWSGVMQDILCEALKADA